MTKESPLTPAQQLQHWLDEHHFEITLSPLRMRNLEDGSLLLDQSQLIITEKQPKPSVEEGKILTS